MLKEEKWVSKCMDSVTFLAPLFLQNFWCFRYFLVPCTTATVLLSSAICTNCTNSKHAKARGAEIRVNIDVK
jgi:hypothetical protein